MLKMTDTDAIGIVKRRIEENLRSGVTIEQICAVLQSEIGTGPVSLSVAAPSGDRGSVYICTFYGPRGSLLSVP